MRKYRMGLIQTAGQLRFSFQTIIEGSKKILGNGKGSHSAAAAAIVNSSSSSNSCRQAVLNSSNNSTGNVNAGAADVKMIQRLNGVIEAAKRKNEEEEEDDEEEEDEVDSDELNEENDELEEEEEEEDEAEEVEDEDDDDDIILDGSTEQPPPPPPTESSANNKTSALESAELRKAQREAKRQKTLETIRAIKRKQKAVEDRLALTSRLVKWLTPVAVCGIAIGLYYLYLSRRADDSLLRVNLE